MPGDDGGVVFLAAEAAAGFHLHDAHLVLRQAKQHDQRAVNVVGALQRPVHRDAAILRHGQHAVRLDVEVLLVARPVLALEDEIGASETLVEIALRNRDRLEHRGRLCRVEHRQTRPVLDVDLRLQQALAILVRQQQDRLRHVAHLAIGQARLVVHDERHEVSSRDVPGANDREPGGVEVEADTFDASAGNGGADRPGVEHSRERQVINVTGCP